MEIKNKKVILGFILIFISSWILIIEVPNLDDEINLQKDIIQNVLQNQNTYQNLLQSTSIILNQRNILIEINPKSKEFLKMDDNLRMLLRQMLLYQHFALNWAPPDDLTYKEWQSLDVNQLALKHNEIISNYKQNTNTGIGIHNLNDVNTKIKDLKIKKRYTLFGAVILNIIGLTLTHSESILDKYWRKD